MAHLIQSTNTPQNESLVRARWKLSFKTSFSTRLGREVRLIAPVSGLRCAGGWFLGAALNHQGGFVLSLPHDFRNVFSPQTKRSATPGVAHPQPRRRGTAHGPSRFAAGVDGYRFGIVSSGKIVHACGPRAVGEAAIRCSVTITPRWRLVLYGVSALQKALARAATFLRWVSPDDLIGSDWKMSASAVVRTTLIFSGSTGGHEGYRRAVPERGKTP